MKNVVLIFILLLNSNIFFGQTLVRLGRQNISRQEFLSAFHKNNSKVKATEKAYREYLNLYIRYRLKVQAATDMKLDTLSGQRVELKNFRSQILDQYLHDETSLNVMANEAFIRSQKDIRVSYIFVSAPKNASGADTSYAFHKIQEAYQALKAGRDFGETAIRFSEDPFVKNNHGDIGFVTVFDLPYVMETVAYKTPAGRYSLVFRTDGGYIILKKTGERQAEGRIRAAQILLIFPYQASEKEKTETRLRADSIYQLVRNGADFGEMAKKFSGDNLSYQLGGVLPEFGIGKYEPGFENTAFDLAKDGEISTPYESSYGYHIIKRMKRIPVSVVADTKTMDELKEKIKSDPRLSVSRKQMLQTILKQTRFKQFIPANKLLWGYTDSLLNNKKPAAGVAIGEKSILFQIEEKKYFIADWMAYRKGLRSMSSLSNGKTNEEIFDLYRQTIAFDYYKDNLENYNQAFAAQVKEFREGNLLFEVMQLQIWNRAAYDTAGLRKYFDTHTKEYLWKPGAAAIIFSSNVPEAAEKLKSRLGQNMMIWRKELDSLAGQVQADSGRFELKQIPGKLPVQEGKFTSVVKGSDKSLQFAYIIRLYNISSPRTFDEARGLVISDYQNELENRWIDELKKRYPVYVNEAVFKTLPK